MTTLTHVMRGPLKINDLGLPRVNHNRGTARSFVLTHSSRLQAPGAPRLLPGVEAC